MKHNVWDVKTPRNDFHSRLFKSKYIQNRKPGKASFKYSVIAVIFIKKC